MSIDDYCSGFPDNRTKMLKYINNEAPARITPNIMFLRRALERATGAASVSVDSVFVIFASQINIAHDAYIYTTITYKQGIRHSAAKLHELS